MNIIYKTGDLLSASERVIVHGCNAQGVMGKGVAKCIKDRYPLAYAEYRSVYETFGLTLGQTIWVVCDPHIVVNAITQEDYRRVATDPGVHVDYDAVRAVFHEINAVARMSKITNGVRKAHGNVIIESVAIPLIGAGLAGGSWKKISQIIENECTDTQPVVYLK